MNLFDLIGTDKVIKTCGSKKLTINGKTSLYPVYKIKLDLLYYNDQNDRIATYISKYNSENKNITDLPLEERNNKVIMIRIHDITSIPNWMSKPKFNGYEVVNWSIN